MFHLQKRISHSSFMGYEKRAAVLPSAETACRALPEVPPFSAWSISIMGLLSSFDQLIFLTNKSGGGHWQKVKHSSFRFFNALFYNFCYLASGAPR